MNRLQTILPGLALSLLAACAAVGPGPGAPAAETARDLPPPAPPTAPVPPELAAAAAALEAEVRGHLAGKGPARSDGWVYSADVATLLLHAAQRGDASLYDSLRPAAAALILQDPDDPYTGGFVLARTKQDARPVASDAAAALWMARALWTGAGAFGRAEDRALARAILDGYARHAYVLQGVWLARRSFDFATRSFAGISGVIEYQPDFLARAERAGGSPEWRGFAERSYALLERAATPGGLLHPVVQPEIGATWPGAGLEVYAPNGIAPLEESCLAAAGAAAGLPRIGRALLDFALAAEAGGRLRARYDLADGSAAGSEALSAGGIACLSRLASLLDHAGGLAVFDPRLTAELGAAARARAALPGTGPLLLAAQARGAF